MVQRMLGGVTATALAAETGISQPTLSRWRREAATVRDMAVDKPGFSRPSSPSNPPSPARRPEDWTAEEKLRAVVEAGQLAADELGLFLRQRGLHEAQIRQWREAALGALGPQSKKGPGSEGDKKRIRELEKQLHRKDKALAETAALLVLQKKAHAIWGDGDGGTDPESGG